ncbi:MAG: hypothetical protein LC803_11030 [Acidobacteria bacterium]|nr:hypothetical protein [Acidobacteriota bacterium]
MIEEEEFRAILSVAGRALDVYGLNEASDPPRVTHTEGELTISNKSGVIDIFFRGSLVFRHDPKGEITDFFETDGVWIDAIERMGLNIPSSSSGIASRRK